MPEKHVSRVLGREGLKGTLLDPLPGKGSVDQPVRVGEGLGEAGGCLVQVACLSLVRHAPPCPRVLSEAFYPFRSGITHGSSPQKGTSSRVTAAALFGWGSSPLPGLASLAPREEGFGRPPASEALA